jgi:hypothetical protein
MDEVHSDEEKRPPVDVRRKRRRYDQFRNTLVIPGGEIEQQSDTSDDDDEGSQLDEEELDFVDKNDLFATPGLNLDYDPNKVRSVDINDSWILLWIFKFQERFRLSDVAINSLISFFGLVLKNIDPIRFKEFPSTEYMARKLLDIKRISKVFAVCTDCNKLYNPAEIISEQSNSGFKCINVEFPNHPMKNHCKSCGSELLTKVPVNNGYNWRPKMVYPVPCLKTQLAAMYKRSEFKETLRK